MSGDVVIRAEGLGKKYVIGHQAERESYVALRDVIARSAKGLARSAADMVRGRPNVVGDEVEEFWALKDVSFEIKRGEVVGVIGRNGAGKSTLLKVLSRITEPTEGRVEIRGRVASLLEVGTGFHPELTGRENIYLNGAVLGMTHAEIRRKFDEIVAFAEVEKFLDTPVKRYSSGMYVRLAFAVAAHLEPEILIVDEVLAVGDAEFQKKCLGKMGEVAGHGRTVLFVSHNLAAIQKLCSHSLLLRSGRLEATGKTADVSALYLSSNQNFLSNEFNIADENPTSRHTGLGIKFLHFSIENQYGQPAGVIPFRQSFTVNFRIESIVSRPFVLIGFSIVSRDGREIFGSSRHDFDQDHAIRPGIYTISAPINPNMLTPGQYTIRAAIFEKEILYHHIDDVAFFEISDGITQEEFDIQRHLVGDIHYKFVWDIKYSHSHDHGAKSA
jgi:lipopolysaccharide transport system ATP-binding protein